MGRLFRVFRGDWKKNRRDHWHFLPTPGEQGWSMYMDDPKDYELLEGAIREQYGLGVTTPVVITYGLPDWMLFPSGHIPPLTISTSADLHSLLTPRPWVTEVTILVTIGARNVAEYNYLRRANFTIGTTTYVVDGWADDRAQAQYEALVFGERLVTSEVVMREIFGEQEMEILYRVALEMDHVDIGGGGNGVAGVRQRMNVIHIEDAENMVDATNMEADPPQMGGSFGGPNNTSAAAGEVDPFNASQAPSVLWDVGVEVVNYPSFINNRSGSSTNPKDTALWRGLMEEGARRTGVVDLEVDGATKLVEDPSGEGEKVVVDVSSSTGSAAIVCSQYGGSVSVYGTEMGEVNSIASGGEEKYCRTDSKQATDGMEASASKHVSLSPQNLASAPASPLSAPGLSHSSAAGEPNDAPPQMKTEIPMETSSEGSHTEGG